LSQSGQSAKLKDELEAQRMAILETNPGIKGVFVPWPLYHELIKALEAASQEQGQDALRELDRMIESWQNESYRTVEGIDENPSFSEAGYRLGLSKVRNEIKRFADSHDAERDKRA
jgi:hypothetical protein